MNEQSLVDTPQTGVALAVNPIYALVDKAILNNAGADQITQLIELIKFNDEREAKRAFNKAFTKAQNEFPEIVKRGEAHRGTKYATYSDVVAAIRPVLEQNGLSFRHEIEGTDKAITVTCILAHEDGHFETASLTAGHDSSGSKNSIQAVGSSTSYLKRYTLEAVTGVITVNSDDDGHAAVPDPEIQLINAKQIKELESRLEQLPPINKTKLLRWLSIDKLSDIHINNYESALEVLDEKIAEQTESVQ